MVARSSVPSRARSRALALALVWALALPVGSAVAQAPIPKDVAAPVSDLLSGRVRLPEPAALGQRSALATRPLEWRLEDGAAVTELVLDVAAGAPVRVVLATARAGLLALTRDEGAGARALDGVAAPAPEWRTLPSGAPLPEIAWTPAAGGRVRLRATGPRELLDDPGAWIVRDEAPVVLASHLSRHERVAFAPLDVVVALEDAGGLPWPADDARGELLVRSSDGVASLPFALLAGRATVGLPPLPPGPVTLDVVVRARAPDGTPLVRSTRHAFTLVAPALALTGTVQTIPLDALRVALRLGVTAPADARALVAAEVWGHAPDGTPAPATWLARLDRVDAGTLTLVLDRRWLQLEQLAPPYELRAIRVHDPDTFGLVARAERLALPPADLLAPLPALAPPFASTMLTGPGPAAPPGGAGAARPAAGPQIAEPARALMLVHGYCAGGSPWPPGDFSGDLVTFLDPDANRSHDAFAQLMIGQAEAADVDTFGVVGHSQGGNAALHLLTFYWSGLDAAQGPRRIQALATPWSGTPLAGSLADLGKTFGFGCGVNDDLSEDGAPLWLATIPSWARAEVTYWTTANSGSACNAFTGFFLENPEDGVVENFRAQLPGGTNKGLTLGWCHTTGMSNPAAYLDAARNAEMDALAAR